MTDSNTFSITKVSVEPWTRKCEKMNNELSEHETGPSFLPFRKGPKLNVTVPRYFRVIKFNLPHDKSSVW